MRATLNTAGTRGLLWPTLMMLAGLAVLLALGTWQLERKAWKEGLLDAIASRTHLAPISLDEALRRWKAGEDLEYARVRVRGTFSHDKERHLFMVEADGPGMHVYTPLTTASGAVVLVNRGYVPIGLRDRSLRRAGLVEGEVEVVGLIRAPGRAGLFTPANDIARNLWYWRDLAGMSQSVLGAQAPSIVPFFVDAEVAAGSDWPRGGVTRLTLPNRHLEYALTWFGLAAALIAVYFAFVLSRRRSGSRDG
jgi:surfeit locus 1 family protein